MGRERGADLAELLKFCNAASGGDAAATSPEGEFYRRLIKGMRCGILTVDAEARLVMVNEPARQILELDELPEIGVPVEQALTGHPQLAQILRESFHMSSLPNRAEIDLRCRSHKGKTIGFTLSMVDGEDHAPAGAAIFFKDLTHVEHKEEQERLKNRLAALGQMAANLAHEIRNPLASIEVSCSLLKRRLGPGEAAQDLLKKITEEVRRLNVTITSSLEFVRPLSLTLAPAPIDPIIDDALRVAQGRWGRESIQVERRSSETGAPFLMDRGQIRQVFENLFLNAMEAMSEGGKLTIETEIAAAPDAATTPYQPEGVASDPWQGFDRYVVIRVSDTGKGISEEHIDKLFYPFFTTKKHGSGVGLAMAKKIIDSHRGLIDVRSAPGEGAEFTVRLPLIERAQRS